MATTKEQHQEWVEQNPLRRARKAAGLSLMDTAAALGSSLSAVQQWEAGAVTPSEEKLNAIATFAGKPVEAIEKDWQRWLRRQPRAA